MILSWNFAIKAIFCQSLPHSGVMNTDPNWGKWGLQLFGCCDIFCDLLDELPLCSWSNSLWPPTPGKVHHCSVFLPFVDYGFQWAWQLLRSTWLPRVRLVLRGLLEQNRTVWWQITRRNTLALPLFLYTAVATSLQHGSKNKKKQYHLMRIPTSVNEWMTIVL